MKIRGRLRRTHEHPEEIVEIDAAQLSGVFALPEWLRNVGMIAWLTTGVIVLLVGLVWLGSLANAIVMPLIAAGIVASVSSPVVGWLNKRGLPRAAGAALMLVTIILLAAALVVLVVGGIAGQTSEISSHLSGAESKIAGWLKDLGVDPSQAKQSAHDAGTTSSQSVKALLNGVAHTIEGLSSLAFFLGLTALSLFFLLKDGPTIKAWTERALPIPLSVAQSVTQRVLQSLRGYFLGVTLIAAYNALVVGIGGLILGVPSLGTIVVVTFLGGFIPYLGAWAAGAFAVLIALGGGGTSEAIGMAVVLLLANGVLQQLVQPFAYGAALGIHPLAVLVVTIAGGAIFGAVGLILAAPMTSAIVRITGDVARARAAEQPPAADTAAAEAPS
jgi:putative heme transporter